MTKRRYLTIDEVSSLLNAARHQRHGLRNYCLILMAFRHGYRISELLRLRITDIDMMSGQIDIRRSKNGFSTIHPMDAHEKAIIQQWLTERKQYPSARQSDLLLISERGTSLSRKQAWHIIKKCGERSAIGVSSHPHMLRHACGYTLANEGADTRLIQDYLGHRNIRHTVHYTQGNPERFAGVVHMMKMDKTK